MSFAPPESPHVRTDFSLSLWQHDSFLWRCPVDIIIPTALHKQSLNFSRACSNFRHSPESPLILALARSVASFRGNGSCLRGRRKEECGTRKEPQMGARSCHKFLPWSCDWGLICSRPLFKRLLRMYSRTRRWPRIALVLFCPPRRKSKRPRGSQLTGGGNVGNQSKDFAYLGGKSLPTPRGMQDD